MSTVIGVPPVSFGRAFISRFSRVRRRLQSRNLFHSDLSTIDSLGTENRTPIPTDDWFAFNSTRTLQSPFYTPIHCSFHHENQCGANSTHSTIYILRIFFKSCVRERHSPSSNRLTWQPTVFHTFACPGMNHAHICFCLLLVDTATSSDTDFVSNETKSYFRAP